MCGIKKTKGERKRYVEIDFNIGDDDYYYDSVLTVCSCIIKLNE